MCIRDSFTFDLSHHSFDKAKKDMIIKATLENHKVEMPLLLIAEIILHPKRWPVPGIIGVCLFGLFLQRWIFLLQPTFDCLWVLFIGTPDWLLGCETPTQEIPTHCPYRKLNTESFINQLRYSFSRSVSE